MVTFITDPRIAYAQAARDDYRKRSLAPIQLPRNPYGASPLASALQNLTYGYLAGQEGRQASRLWGRFYSPQGLDPLVKADTFLSLWSALLTLRG